MGEKNGTDTLLAELDAALKGITDVGELSESILAPAQFNRFIRQAEHEKVILPVARFLKMEAQQQNIDRTGFVGRILRSGAGAAGAHRTLTAEEFAALSTNTNKLIVQELQAVASLRDKALRRNIERGGFEGTLVDLFGEAAGRDMEEYCLLADTEWAHADDDVLSKTDGWIRKAANKVYGRNVAGQVARDWDTASETAVDDMFQAMLEALPKQFFQDPGKWRFYVTWDNWDAYRNLLRARGTLLGDAATTDNITLAFKGIPVVYCPMLERAASVDLLVDADVKLDRVEGRMALLTHPDNMVWGLFHEVTIEREREAKERRTDFVLTLEADAHYEDENAVVVAFQDKANPALA